MIGKILALGALCASIAAAPLIPQQGSKDLIQTRSAEPEGQALYTNSHALIIGINKYPNLPQPLQLRFAEKDAQDVRDMLVKGYGFDPTNVTVLTNEKATLANIRRELSQLASSKRVKADDRILVYFSGHGQTVKLPTGGEMGFLVPSDARIDMADPTDAGPYLETCLPMRQVWDFLASSPAKHAAVIADACFSGMLVSSRSVSMSSDTVKAMLARPARQVLTAGAMGQKTFERQDLGHGVFTYKFLEELRVRSADKGKVFSLMDLYMSLQNSVSNVTSGRQIPQFGSYETEGQMLFCSGSALTAGTGVSDGGGTGGANGSSTGGKSTGGEVTPPIVNTKAKLTINSTPAGAALLIDGQRKGSTPYSMEVDLKAAKEANYKVRLELKGYQPAETTATLKPGETVQMPIQLQKLPDEPPPVTTAKIAIETNPVGATIFIDGKKRGTAPFILDVDLRKAQQQTFRIRAEMRGYVPSETTATAKRGESLSVPLELQAEVVKPPPTTTATGGATGTSGTSGGMTTPRNVKQLALAPVSTLTNTLPVSNLSFSPDGKRLAATGLDYGLTLFDVGKSGSGRRIEAAPRTIVRITPDWSKLLFIRLLTDGEATWATVEVKDAAKLATKNLFRVDLKPGASLDDVYAGNGRLILAGSYGTASARAGFCAVADFDKGEATIFSSGYRIRSATSSADGSTYAVYVEPVDLRSTGFVTVISSDLSKQPVRMPTEDCNSAAGVVLSSDGKYVAVSCQKVQANGSAQILGTRIYDTATGQQLQFLPKLRAGAFTKGGQRLLGWRTQIGGPIVELLDVASGNGLGEIQGNEIWLSRDEKIAAQAAPDGTINIYRLDQP